MYFQNTQTKYYFVSVEEKYRQLFPNPMIKCNRLPILNSGINAVLRIEQFVKTYLAKVYYFKHVDDRGFIELMY